MRNKLAKSGYIHPFAPFECRSMGTEAGGCPLGGFYRVNRRWCTVLHSINKIAHKVILGGAMPPGVSLRWRSRIGFQTGNLLKALLGIMFPGNIQLALLSSPMPAAVILHRSFGSIE